MRRTGRFVCLTVASVAGLLACNGGVGSVSDLGGGWDDDHGLRSQRERPPGTTETPLDTSESPPRRGREPSPSNGGGALVCSGIYECLLTGESRTCVSTNDGPTNCTSNGKVTLRIRIALSEKNGVCFIGEAALLPDGTLKGGDDDETGRWALRGNQIYISADQVEGYCYPSSGPVGLVGSDGNVVEGSGSSSSSSSSSSGDISIDPGTGQDGGS